MSNFYTDDPDLVRQLETLDLRRIVALREDDYQQARDFAYAPRDYDDALDSYRRTLEIVGDIAGEFVAPRAEDVDRAGATLTDGEVCYAPGISEALERLTQADLMGITLPRRYGGLNFPVTVSVMIVEMISRADPALMNVFGLQDIAETVNKFAADELKQAYLPRFASGEVTGSMALTEPEAGSDLQNVQLKATLGADGVWRLNGVKRFITNGCGQVSLVLARSEEGTTDARGLSMFLYERDEHMKIRRLEDKLGIHGSPTCELQFDDAPALLVGERRRGLTTYVMSLMNGARVAIAAQAQGIAEAAYRAASKYADERVQFGGPIRELTAVAAMLADMKVAIEASRALLYETATIVDLKEGIEGRVEQLQSGERAAAGDDELKELRGDLKKYSRLAALYTPLAKACATEMANGWPTTRCRSTAARATCATSRSNATPATRASPTSTRARRSFRSWPPSAACCRAPSPLASTSTTPRTFRPRPSFSPGCARPASAGPPPWPTCEPSTTRPSATFTAAAWSRPPLTSSAPICCCAPPSATRASCWSRATSSSR